MQRSLDIAVSGLKANQTKMDVISNNIANANTIAFKRDQVRFSDIVYEKMRAATAATGGKAGMNPMSVGLGVKIDSIDTVHTQGILTSTGKDLDIAIQGDGFFAVTDGITSYYTRNGNLSVSPADGALCLPNGMKILGYVSDANGNVSKTTLKPIVLPLNQNTIAKATTSITLNNNLDKKLAAGESVDVPSYYIDSLGTKHDINMKVTMTGVGTATWAVTDAGGIPLLNSSGTLTFDTSGKLSAMTGGPISLTPPGAQNMTFNMDLTGVTYFDKDTNIAITKQDGLTPGNLQNFSITDGGVIQGNYSNGMIKVLGQIPLTMFDNPTGLEQAGNGLYNVTENSGEPQMKLTGETPSAIISKYLESSNVDLSEELTDMIKTQRSFQVSSKVITTSDEMLQDLINIKR